MVKDATVKQNRTIKARIRMVHPGADQIKAETRKEGCKPNPIRGMSRLIIIG
jgi:hypothetical protein